MSAVTEPTPIGVGVVGLGMGAMLMVPTLEADERVCIAGVVEPDDEARTLFAEDFDTAPFDTVSELAASPEIDVVYIASPHQFHAEQTLEAVRAGCHVLVEKPLALDVATCLAVAEGADLHGVHVIVGHTHAFDPTARAIDSILRSGRLGDLAMVNTWNFGPFLYRPRRPEELDTSKGGGIIFNQLPHQVDVVRLLGGGLVRSVRSAAFRLDPRRPTEGTHTTFLEFENGAAATLVYSGNDYFDTDEWHDWVGELGNQRPSGNHGGARRALRELPDRTESTQKAGRRYGGSFAPSLKAEESRQAHFGVLVASCSGGDVRWGPDGPLVYTESGVESVQLPVSAAQPDRTPVIDDVCAAVRLGQAPTHSARWGAATIEVCQAVLRSAHERREVFLEHQVSVSEHDSGR